MIVPDINLLVHAYNSQSPAHAGARRWWLERPYVSVVLPGDRHAEILFGLFDAVGTAANLTTNGHLAALAIEHQAELQSTDADFARFPGLRWTNPLA